MRRRFVGDIGRLMGAIPVKRPQDYAKAGTGSLSSANTTQMIGTDTIFTIEVSVGDSLKGQGWTCQVKSVESDTILTTDRPCGEIQKQQFKIIPKMNHSEMFKAVENELKRGRCIGIFPEGGSHDRSTLLPLKVGVCLMALGSMSRHGIPLTIQCVGLNYFQGHKFRSKALVNFGEPYKIPREYADLYLKDSKIAVNKLLKQIEKRLKSVWVTADTYDELNSILTLRSIYKPDDIDDDPSLDTQLDKKFASAYSQLKQQYKELPEFDAIITKTLNYNEVLKRYGIEDKMLRNRNLEMKNIVWEFFINAIKFIVSLLGIPAWLFTGAIALILRPYSEKERKRALKNSEVKISAQDVLASYKIVYGLGIFTVFTMILGCIVYVLLYNSYGSHFSAFYYTSIFFFLWPTYYYVSINMLDSPKQVISRSIFRIRSFCSPNTIDTLRQSRNELKDDITNIVKKYGPQMYPGMKPGEIFKKKAENFDEMAEEAFKALGDIGI